MRHLYLLSVLISLPAIVISSCTDRKDNEEDAESVRVTVVVASEVQYQHRINSSGRLTPYSELKLSFKTGGIINNMPVRDGQDVGRGDLIAALDLSEVRSHLRQAELQHEKALRDYERVSNLYHENASTLEHYQNALTAMEIAEAAKSIARFNLDHSVIRAPSDGKVLKVLADENEIIAPGHPVILFASSRDHWLLKVPVTDRDIVDVYIGEKAEVWFDAYPHHAFDARVVEIAGMADPFTGTFEVSLAISAEGYRLMTGFIGRASIITAKVTGYIEIPADALVEASGREGMVFRYSGNTALRERIRIQEINGDRLLVTGGIQPGDTIIREGAAFITDGQQVIIN